MGSAGELIAEFDGSTGNLKKEYVYGGATLITIEPTAMNSNGTRYTTADNLGSPRVITNSSAGVVSRHDYMPFGEELGAGIGGRTSGIGFGVADGNRKKFTGYERDTETGLDYAQARYYSSGHGRFTSPDPFQGSASVGSPQTFNRYAYVGNNPVNAVDPTGLQQERIPARPGAGSQLETVDGSDPIADEEARYENGIKEVQFLLALAEAVGWDYNAFSELSGITDPTQQKGVSCPVAPPTDPQELSVAGALMGELYSERQAIYASEDHTTYKKGKKINPKSIGEETYGHILAEAYEMVSVIKNRAEEKGKTWSEIVNEKQANGHFQIEGNATGPGYLKLIGSDVGLCTRLLAIETAISMVKQTGGDPRFNYWKGVVQPGNDGPFVRNINGVKGALTPGAVRIGATDFYRAKY